MSLHTVITHKNIKENVKIYEIWSLFKVLVVFLFLYTDSISDTSGIIDLSCTDITLHPSFVLCRIIRWFLSLCNPQLNTHESAQTRSSGQLRHGSVEKREKKRNDFTLVEHDQNITFFFCLLFLSKPMWLRFHESICICVEYSLSFLLSRDFFIMHRTVTTFPESPVSWCSE